MIIYEVNIKYDSNIFLQLKPWLLLHAKKMITFKGFTDYKIYIDENLTNILSIHYHIKNIECFNEYINNHSKEMREEGIKKFGKSIKARRRILSKVDYNE